MLLRKYCCGGLWWSKGCGFDLVLVLPLLSYWFATELGERPVTSSFTVSTTATASSSIPLRGLVILGFVKQDGSNGSQPLIAFNG